MTEKEKPQAIVTHLEDLPDETRREILLHGIALTALSALGGCGGGSQNTATPATSGTPPVTSPPSIPELGKYRYQQANLFQTIPAASIPPRITGGSAFALEGPGPHYEYVDRKTGWVWAHPGGDWLDANQVSQGTQPWFAVATNAVSGSSAFANYTVDVTAALQFVQSNDRWCAFLLRGHTAPRTIAGLFQSQHPLPVITVQYQNGSNGTLKCLLIGGMNAATSIPLTTAGKYSLPVVIEFERPVATVLSATLHFTVVEHWSGSNTVVDGFILDPPINTVSITQGPAATAGLFDANLSSNTQVIGVHRYVDGSVFEDFVATFSDPLMTNTGAERNYDPAIYGTGPTDTSKFPHNGLGKWIGGKNWSLVNSVYSGEDFEPLAPGLGAMKVVMPLDTDAVGGSVKDGSVILSTGTVGANSFIFLPEPDFGFLKRIFVRYYLRLAAYQPSDSKRYHVSTVANDPTFSKWVDMGGKTGIMPSHVTTYGGVSGSAGGGYGWQMRLAWADRDGHQGLGGATEPSITLGLHTFDFLSNNPIQYGSLDKTRDTHFGQQGGLGGVIYHNRWYCIEVEVDLNTVMTATPGYLQDGAIRAWIDGRLAFERTGMVMRSLPLINPAYSSTQLRPCRELGHRDLWFNWFHGGLTPNTIERTVFFTGLAWSRSYIGPMKLA